MYGGYKKLYRHPNLKFNIFKCEFANLLVHCRFIMDLKSQFKSRYKRGTDMALTILLAMILNISVIKR